MKKISILFMVLLQFFAGALSAQNDSVLQSLYTRMTDSCVTMDYSYVLQSSDIKTTGDGNILLQGSNYVMKGNGLQINCEGNTMWIIDPEGKEVIMQSASEGEQAYMDNPVLLFVDMPKLFNIDSVRRTGQVSDYTLSPSVSCGIKSAMIEVTSDAKSSVITSAHFALSDGGELDIKIKSMIFSEKKPLTSFFYDVSGLDSSWLITDLR